MKANLNWSMFKTLGYLVIRGAFSDDQIRAVNDLTAPLQKDDANWKNHRQSGQSSSIVAEWYEIPASNWKDWPLHDNRAFEDLISYLNALAGVFLDDPEPHSSFQLARTDDNYVAGNSDHVDGGVNPEPNCQNLLFGVALTSTPEWSEGGFRLRPRSHEAACKIFLSNQAKSNFNDRRVDVENNIRNQSTLPLETISMNCGDVIVLHGLLMHRVASNDYGSTRDMLFQRRRSKKNDFDSTTYLTDLWHCFKPHIHH